MSVGKKVVALGFFDGVHLGHQALMARTREQAEKLGVEPAVITFDRHPDSVVFGTAVPLLSTTTGRMELIRQTAGIQNIIVLHFDELFMQTPWERFIRSVVEEMGAVHLVMGHDFSCGWRGEGRAGRIRAWCADRGIGCDVIPPVLLDGVVVSSTYIRRLVMAGDMEEASRFLGHPYSVSDTVVHGYERGRRMGIPTINFPIPEGIIVPRYGVYATRAWLPDGPHPAITNIGVRPTFQDDGHVTVETNLLDFEGELYGTAVRVELLAFIRDERRFPSGADLSEQIRKDRELTRAYFQNRGELL